MSPIHPDSYFKIGYLNSESQSLGSIVHFDTEEQNYRLLNRPVFSAVALQIDNNQKRLKFTLSQANPELVKELLLFMLSKNWLLPTADINSFIKNGNSGNGRKKELIPVLPNVENKIQLTEKRNLLITKNEFLLAVNKVIEDHLDDEKFRPSCLSKKVFLCEMQLHRKLKKLTGFSPSNYIRQYRLLRSLSFLKKSELSVSEVSIRVGFRSLEYFSRSFKAVFGICPSNMKKQL